MKILKDRDEIMKALASKKENLERILRSEEPFDEALHDSHVRRQRSATWFLAEMTELEEIIKAVYKAMLVPSVTFQKQIEKSDFASIEMDGLYCRAAVIQNYPGEKFWIIYTASLNTL